MFIMGFWETLATAKVYTWQELKGLYPSVEPEFKADEKLLVLEIMSDTQEVLELYEELNLITYKYKIEKK